MIVYNQYLCGCNIMNITTFFVILLQYWWSVVEVKNNIFK